MPELAGFGWLSVDTPAQEDLALALMALPPAQVFDEQTTAQLHELMVKGGAGTVFLATADCRATCAELAARA